MTLVLQGTTSVSNMTKTSMSMGTEVYMAPEQMNAKHVDGKADQYAFSMILYQLLNGRLPWDVDASAPMITFTKMSDKIEGIYQTFRP